MRMLVVITFLTVQGLLGFTQSCLLDPDFGNKGKAIGFTGLNPYPRTANILIQPDGKIIQAASISNSNNFDFALVRYNSNGTLDSAFGSNGIATTTFGVNNDDYVSAAALHSDGKIVVVGSSNRLGNTDFALARYNGNGRLDSSFGINGKLLTDISPNQDAAEAVVIQPDGKIIIAGSTDRLDTVLCRNDASYIPSSVLLRYTSTGDLDSTFGQHGKIITIRTNGYDRTVDAVLQKDGKIVIAGTNFFDCECDYDWGGAICFGSFMSLSRFNSNGSIDSTFGKNGQTSDSLIFYGTSVALQTDGKMVTTGANLQNEIIVKRYQANGMPDNTFGTNGKITTIIGNKNHDNLWPNDVFIQPDGRVLIGGRFFNANAEDFILIRYNTNGSLDSTFNGNGIVVLQVGSEGSGDAATGVGVQGNKVIAGGYSNVVNPEVGNILLIRLMDSVQSFPVSITPQGNIDICQGGTVKLTGKANGNLQWYKNDDPISGARDTVFFATSTGNYTARISDSGKCGISASVNILVNENPLKPTISYSNMSLTTDNLFGHYFQWFLNDTVIAGATASSYTPPAGKSGKYKVRISDINGCYNTSLEYNLLITGITDLTIGNTKIRYYPNPASTILNVDIPGLPNAKIRAGLYDITGRVVKMQLLNKEHNEISIQHLTKGIYQLVLYKDLNRITVPVIVIVK